MADFFPIGLDVHGQRCLVVGAGPTAAEKIDQLLTAGAQIQVVAPAACRAVEMMAEVGTIVLARRPFEPDDVDGARLVIAATNDWCVNDQVIGAARTRGVLANVADDPAHCDFILPAVINREPIQIAVSTGGSPALDGLLRKRLEAAIGPEYGALGILLNGVRDEAREADLHVPPTAWQGVCDDYLLDLLRTDHHPEALHLLRTRLVSATLAEEARSAPRLRCFDDDLEPIAIAETRSVAKLLAAPIPA